CLLALLHVTPLDSESERLPASVNEESAPVSDTESSVALASALDMSDVEDVGRWARVVAGLVHLEVRVGVVRQVGGRRPGRRGVVLYALVASEAHALEDATFEIVNVHAPEEVVVLAEPEPVARVGELHRVLRHQLDDVTRLAVHVLRRLERRGGLAVV